MSKLWDKFTFKVHQEPETASTVFSVATYDHVFHSYGKEILADAFRAVSKQLADEWIKRHGAEVLEGLTPGEMQEQVAAALKTKIATAVFGGK